LLFGGFENKYVVDNGGTFDIHRAAYFRGGNMNDLHEGQLVILQSPDACPVIHGETKEYTPNSFSGAKTLVKLYAINPNAIYKLIDSGNCTDNGTKWYNILYCDHLVPAEWLILLPEEEQ
jgi:hypothetical protein